MNRKLVLMVPVWPPLSLQSPVQPVGSPTQIVRLHFQKMKISQKTKIKPDDSDCGEYLILYDADWANPQKIIKAFCSSFSEAKEDIDYITKGSSMFINFVSNSGSYSGSSIYYWAIYDFHEASIDGDIVEDSICDQQLTLRTKPKVSNVFLRM